MKTKHEPTQVNCSVKIYFNDNNRNEITIQMKFI